MCKARNFDRSVGSTWIGDSLIYMTICNTGHCIIRVDCHYCSTVDVALGTAMHACFLPHSQHSNLLNQARLTVLKSRDDYVKTIIEEAKGRVGEITRDSGRYKRVVQDLIIQVEVTVIIEIIHLKGTKLLTIKFRYNFLFCLCDYRCWLYPLSLYTIPYYFCLQGLYQLLESKVVLRTRKEDVAVVKVSA